MKGCVSNDVDMLRKLTCFFKLWPIGYLLLSHWLTIAGRSLIGPNSHQWESWSMANIAGRFLIGNKSINMLTSWAYPQHFKQLINRLSWSRTPQLPFVTKIFFDSFCFLIFLIFLIFFKLWKLKYAYSYSNRLMNQVNYIFSSNLPNI